jgi:hypothetical protein
MAVAAGCSGTHAPTATQASTPAAAPVLDSLITSAAAPSSSSSKRHQHGTPIPVSNVTGVKTLANIEQFVIVWQGMESLGAQVSAFNKWMLSSDYWVNSMAEYGVGPGRHMGLVVIPNAAPATLDDSQVTPLIEGMIANGTLPQPNPNTVYAFIIPPTTLSTAFGAFGCFNYGGYHTETNSGDPSKPHVPYSINVQCYADPQLDSPFDNLTLVMSHETAETASDPIPDVSLGWVAGDGEEIGDLCEFHPGDTYVANSDCDEDEDDSTAYYVQRIYSGRAAKLGGSHDPCRPVPFGLPFYGVTTGTDNTLTVTTDTNGNGTFNLPLNVFSYGTNSDLQYQVIIEAYPFGAGFFGVARPGTAVSFPFQLQGTPSATYPIVTITTAHDGSSNEVHGLLNVTGSTVQFPTVASAPPTTPPTKGDLTPAMPAGAHQCARLISKKH